MRSLKVRNPFLTLTWLGDLTFGDRDWNCYTRCLIQFSAGVEKMAALRTAIFSLPAKTGGGHIMPPSIARVYPRPGGGLSHLRHGGGSICPPSNLKTKRPRRSRDTPIESSHWARSNLLRSFFAQFNIEFTRGHWRTFLIVLSGMTGSISGPIIVTQNLKRKR